MSSGPFARRVESYDDCEQDVDSIRAVQQRVRCPEMCRPEGKHPASRALVLYVLRRTRPRPPHR